MSQRIVASMIVRNEMDRLLPLAVAHLKSYCAEIRVLDDGSDDGTFEWLLTQDKVAVTRNPGPSFFEHEGQARQHLIEWTFAAKPDYVLAIDADEFIGEPDRVLEAVKDEQPVYLLRLVEAWKVNPGGISIRVDGLWGPRKVPILYMPPDRIPVQSAARRPQRYGTAAATDNRMWRIADRQLACGREPMAVVRAAARAPMIQTFIYHFGWTRQSERQARAERYFEHDQGRFHQDRHLQSILFPDDKVGLRGHSWPPGLRSISEDLLAYAER